MDSALNNLQRLICQKKKKIKKKITKQNKTTTNRTKPSNSSKPHPDIRFVTHESLLNRN